MRKKQDRDYYWRVKVALSQNPTEHLYMKYLSDENYQLYGISVCIV